MFRLKAKYVVLDKISALLCAIVLACACQYVAAQTVADAPNMAEGRESTASKSREYRAYALQHQGDALRGQGVFKNESKAACIKCHSTDGKVAKHKDKPSTGYVDSLLRERRARDSNSQPLAGHYISSVAASHSLTLLRFASSSIVTGGGACSKAACRSRRKNERCGRGDFCASKISTQNAKLQKRRDLSGFAQAVFCECDRSCWQAVG